jgi:hypothetical protein
MARDLSRLLMPPTPRERAIRGLPDQERAPAPIQDPPARIGPVEFSTLAAMVAVRCPHEFDDLMRKAGGMFEPGSRRWLIMRHRVGPLIRNLERVTDPLFRHAGMDLDRE